MDDPIGQCHIREAGIPYTQTGFPPEESASVYWEPLADAPLPPQLPGTPQVRWDLWAGENTGDEGVQAHLRADYTIPSQANPTMGLPRYYNQEFVIKTRELNPNGDADGDDGSTPLQGSDVAMLEAMLWQFGISPQRGADQLSQSNAGYQGARINSSRNRNGIGNWTYSCQGEEVERRDVYYSGWGANCPVGHVSLEGMVRRFQARNFNVLGDYAGIVTTTHIDGIVGNGTLSRVQRIWSHYYSAVSRFQEYPEFGYRTLSEQLWTSLLELADEGGNIPYEGNAETYSLEATYTDTVHTRIVEEFPENGRGITREGVFKAWILQEVGYGGYIWGNNIINYQATPYRINEGGGDEQGSMGYNHIVWKRMYGAERSCASNRGYLIDGTENVNLYHPENSALAFLAAASDGDCFYSNGLYRSYIEPEEGNVPAYVVSYEDTTTPRAYCYETIAPTNNNGPRCHNDHAAWLNFEATEDSGYELLGKAVIAYNQGSEADILNDNPYFASLLGTPRRTDRGEFSPTRFGYWLGVKIQSWTIREEIGGYLPFVTYIWDGGSYPEDMPLLDDAGNPQVDENGERILDPRAGQDWCFAFGEREWMGGEAYEDVALAASPEDEFGDPKIPVGQMDCVTGEAL